MIRRSRLSPWAVVVFLAIGVIACTALIGAWPDIVYGLRR